MDLFGRNMLRRQQILVTALHAQTPTLTSLLTASATGPEQPTDPAHPGSAAYPYSDFTVNSGRIWHLKFFALYPTTVTYLVPVGKIPVNGFPVIAVSPGKFLDDQSHYTRLLRHICLKGYIVMFVDADTGPLDCEHSRMATEFLEIVRKTIEKRLAAPLANLNRVAWWGHSMGAKVQAIAARMTDNSNYVRPVTIIANNFSNDKGNFCNDDAVATAAGIPASIWYNLIEGDQDTISNQDPRLLYRALPHLPHRQLIKATSYAPDELIADHYAPITDGVLPVTGKVNALDWWLYWKIAVGAFDYHFKGGSDKWAYGSERTNGGTDSAGHKIEHQIDS